MRNLERGALLGCGGMLAREYFRPARTGAGVSAKKFAQRTIKAPKMAFYGLLGELFRGISVGGGVLGEFSTGIARRGRERGQFCTGSGSACGIKFSLLGLLVAKAVKSSPCAQKVGRNQRFGACRESFVPVDPVEPGSRASFVSLRARCGLHRAFLAPIAPPIDAAVMRCRYTWARWPCPTGQREPHPGSVGYTFIAPRKPPAHASYGGGRYCKECMGCKQTRATRGTLAPPSISRHQQATQASQPNLAVQAPRTHFFSSVTRYTLVSRSWNPARW